MGVRVAFLTPDEAPQTQTVRQAVAVPAQAVDAKGDTGTIFVVNGNTVERRAVRLGGQLPDGRRIVLSGINPGALLAIADFSQLADGISVRIEPPNGGAP